MAVKYFYKGTKLNFENYNLEYGSASKDTQEVICVLCRTYIKTNGNVNNLLENVDRGMANLKSELIKGIRTSPFSGDFIFDYSFPKNIDEEINTKILTFELFLKQKERNETVDKSNELTNLLKDPLNNLSKFLNKNFYLSKTKV